MPEERLPSDEPPSETAAASKARTTFPHCCPRKVLHLRRRAEQMTRPYPNTHSLAGTTHFQAIQMHLAPEEPRQRYAATIPHTRHAPCAFQLRGEDHKAAL